MCNTLTGSKWQSSFKFSTIALFNLFCETVHPCQVTENVMRLHIDGDLVAEAHLCSLSSQPDNQDDAYQVCLLGNNSKVDGYVYNVQVLSMLGTIQEQYAEVMQLS